MLKRQAPEQRLRRRKLAGERLADAGGLILGARITGNLETMHDPDFYRFDHLYART